MDGQVAANVSALSYFARTPLGQSTYTGAADTNHPINTTTDLGDDLGTRTQVDLVVTNYSSTDLHLVPTLDGTPTKGIVIGEGETAVRENVDVTDGVWSLRSSAALDAAVIFEAGVE